MANNVLIVGAGPAGCSAALTLRLRNIDVTLLSAGEGALEKAKRVDNYPGLPAMTGKEMLAAFHAQAKQAGALLRPGLVRYIQRTKKGFTVLAGEELFPCSAVLLATGMTRVSSIAGEEALVGQGVSYCATCDGMLYRGGKVAVIAQNENAHEDARFLSSICTVDYYMEKKHIAPAGISVLDGKPAALSPSDGRIHLQTDCGAADYDCVFILRPAVALTTLLPALELSGEAVRVDAALQTSVPGVFAAGDILGAPYQAARAVGQGNTAALSIAKYLNDKGE